ncbi:MAG: RNA polymerase sigma factor [Deltaproteobacteria bacterium]|nr:RNA polymerase sigma factor [Deltaproteobacteria bacterium]
MPDRAEFEAFYDSYYERVFSYAVRRLMNMQDAQDVTAETFTRALEHFQALRSEPEGRAWLYRTATNLINDMYRRQQRRREDPLEDLLPFIKADPYTSAEEHMAQLEAFARLHALIGKLKETYQDVLMLRYMEGWSVDEIAEILESPVGTVKWRLHTALEKLSEQMRRRGLSSLFASGRGAANE